MPCAAELKSPPVPPFLAGIVPEPVGMLPSVTSDAPDTFPAVVIWANLVSAIAAEAEMLALDKSPFTQAYTTSKFELCSEATIIAPTLKV